jgi:hypothetical protein
MKFLFPKTWIQTTEGDAKPGMRECENASEGIREYERGQPKTLKTLAVGVTMARDSAEVDETFDGTYNLFSTSNI